MVLLVSQLCLYCSVLGQPLYGAPGVSSLSLLVCL